jgi:hypothetical protein
MVPIFLRIDSVQKVFRKPVIPPDGYWITLDIKAPTEIWILSFVVKSLVVSIEMNDVQKDVPWIISRFENSLT